MRSKYITFMDEHKLRDGLLRELCRFEEVNIKTALDSIQDAMEIRKRDIEALKQLHSMVKDAEIVSCSIEENCDE